MVINVFFNKIQLLWKVLLFLISYANLTSTILAFRHTRINFSFINP